VRRALRWNGAVLATSCGLVALLVASGGGVLLVLGAAFALVAGAGLVAALLGGRVKEDAKPLLPTWVAWVAGLVVVASPLLLFFDAAPGEGVVWPSSGDLSFVERAGALAGLVLALGAVCSASGRSVPLALALLLLPPAWIVGWGVNLDANTPCWRYSNAAWCGHFCDDDPCACPQRELGPKAYGAGPGCVAG